MLCSLLFHCCLYRATPFPSLNVIVIPFPNSHTPLPLQLVDKIDAILHDFAQFPFAILFTPYHFYQHTLRFTLPNNFSHNHKLFFPRRFLHSTPLTTQIRLLLPSHKIVNYFVPNIIASTFTQNVIQLPTSTPLRLASTPP